MANRITGSDGQCTVANHNILFNTWSATFSQVVSDVTAFGNSFAQKRGGLMSGTFSASGIMQDNDNTTEPMPTSTDILAFNKVGEDVSCKQDRPPRTLACGRSRLSSATCHLPARKAVMPRSVLTVSSLVTSP